VSKPNEEPASLEEDIRQPFGRPEDLARVAG
jgi:hypothetical protein